MNKDLLDDINSVDESQYEIVPEKVYEYELDSTMSIMYNKTQDKWTYYYVDEEGETYNEPLVDNFDSISINDYTLYFSEYTEIRDTIYALVERE